jgi:hypothetical protein
MHPNNCISSSNLIVCGTWKHTSPPCEANIAAQSPLGQLSMLARRVIQSSRPPLHSLQTASCLRIPTHIANRSFAPPLCRIFTTTPRHRKDVSRIPQPKSTIPPQTEAPERLQPETVETPGPAASKPKADALLAEETVSNAQQRKADWAILREMTAYLWPKV